MTAANTEIAQLSPELRNYAAEFLRTRQRFLDYPMHVHLELSGTCDAKCAFCPYAKSPRKGKRMSEELFGKIVDELEAWPSDRAMAISPFKLNEPLLDETFFERLSVINDRLPRARLWLTTNLHRAGADKLEQLTEVRNLVYVWVSLNSLDADEYRELMGLELEPTLEHVRHLLELNRRRRFTRAIVLGRVGDGTDRDRAFIETAHAELAEFTPGEEFRVEIMPRGEWLGQVDPMRGAMQALPCMRWFELSVTCTGQVALCCMDGLARFPLGDANQHSLHEIYNQPAYRTLREKALQRRIVKPCATCSFS
jgi:hypothetical protein